ncbi:MAG: glycosyltransferase family 2 protein [Methylococcaceae bacterium]|jgi:glycosyltransferase involved in cell wall biosynthesis
MSANLNHKAVVSVITVVFNGEKYLEQTIQSVISQNYGAIEYIIIDGGSTDNSVNIIKRYAESISYWVSEPDNGIAEAMNKGIGAATGEFVVFIHADDYFVNEQCLAAAMQHIDCEHDIFAFDILFGKNLCKKSSRGFSFWFNFRNGIAHQGAICRLSFFHEIGKLDTQYKICMDYDHFLRAYNLGCKAKVIKETLSVMRDSGISSQTDWPSLMRRFTEERAVHRKNIKNKNIVMLNTLFWPCYIFYRKLKSMFTVVKVNKT